MWYSKHITFSRARGTSGFVLMDFMHTSMNTLLRRVFPCRIPVELNFSYCTRLQEFFFFFKECLSASSTSVLFDRNVFFQKSRCMALSFFLSPRLELPLTQPRDNIRKCLLLHHLDSRYGFTVLRARAKPSWKKERRKHHETRQELNLLTWDDSQDRPLMEL